MDHHGNSPEVATERLLLRPHAPEDFDRYWAMLNDPVAKRFTGGVTRMTRAARRAMYDEDRAAPFSDAGAEFAIVVREDGKYAGYCGVRPSEELGGMELFYGLCRDCWGLGYGREAVCAAVRCFFTTLGHEAYLATVDAENLPSLRVMDALGATELRRGLSPEGREELVYALARPAE